MDKPGISVTVTCEGQKTCLYAGRDIPLEITIRNERDAAIGIPMQYLQKRGPVVKLINTQTHRETYLKSNMVDLDLRDVRQTLAPGEVARFGWVILDREIEAIGGRLSPVMAEVAISTTVSVGGQNIDTNAQDDLWIAAPARR